jgi:integrase/recombinase XerD
MSEKNHYTRNGIWWFRATIDGVEIRESLRVGDVKTARRLRDARLTKHQEAREGIDSKSWAPAAAMWVEHVTGQIAPATTKRYYVSLKQCQPFLGKLSLAEIKIKTIADLARAWKASGATTATIRRDLTAVSCVLADPVGPKSLRGKFNSIVPQDDARAL